MLVFHTAPVFVLPGSCGLARAAHWQLVLSSLFMAAPGSSRAVPFPGASLCASEDLCVLPPDTCDLPLAMLMPFAGLSSSSQETPPHLFPF